MSALFIPSKNVLVQIYQCPKQPELFGNTPPTEWGCFKDIKWMALGDGPAPWNGDTVLIFGGGISLAQIFHDRYTDDLHYRGVNCKYGPMSGMFMVPYISHWAVPTWPTYAPEIEQCGWLPDYRRLFDEAPEFNREVLVQFENDSTMAARLVEVEFENTLKITEGVLEINPHGKGVVDADSHRKFSYIFHTLDGAQIMNRAKLWAYFRGESLRLVGAKMYSVSDPLVPVGQDDEGKIVPIDDLIVKQLEATENDLQSAGDAAIQGLSGISKTLGKIADRLS